MLTNSHPLKTKKLLSIANKLHITAEFDRTLQEIADSAAELTGSQGSSILLFEEETQQLYFAAARAQKRESLMEIRVPIENSIAGKVYSQSARFSITNAQNDPQIYRAVEQSVETTTRNLLAIPIIFRNQTLGTLEVINKLDHLDYTQEDLDTLETLAGFAATAIYIHESTQEIVNLAQERQELDRQKTEFIAIASHELRTPLGLVLGHATFLREIASEDIQQKQLDIIVRNAERLKEIIDRLNQVDNFQSGSARLHWQYFDLGKLLESISESFEESVQDRQIKLVITLPQECIQIQCDPAKLSVAIGNVIRNALTFSDEGQSVYVGLHKLPGYAHISVADSGIGIPAKDLHHVFERFYQVESHLTRKHGGMGLGLSVAKAVVESHGGQIWVESILGEGSTFTILLPCENIPT